MRSEPGNEVWHRTKHGKGSNLQPLEDNSEELILVLRGERFDHLGGDVIVGLAWTVHQAMFVCPTQMVERVGPPDEKTSTDGRLILAVLYLRPPDLGEKIPVVL